MNLNDIDITDVSLYAERGYPWQEWDYLRERAPVHWYETDDYHPFWALTRHADILAVSKRPDVFVNSGRLRLFDKITDQLFDVGMRGRAESLGWDLDEPPDLVFMDDPRHREFRSLTARSFTPGLLRELQPRAQELARGFAQEFEAALERNEAAGQPTDLVSEFSTKLPQAIICEMLGLPDEDWPDLLMWTNALVSAPDPEFQLEPDEDPMISASRAFDALRDYFRRWIETCRREGIAGRGLTTLLLEGEIEGRPLSEQQLQGYFTLIVSAGSETTRNALTGGVHALLRHPDQLARLCDDPSLLTSAVEEVLRWTSPVIQFARSAAREFEIGGVEIRKGDSVGMFYPSANRDAAVFEDPYRFDVARSPNHHLAFGHGAHFCLGANLARRELAVMLEALLPILPDLEVAAEPSLVPHLHVGGIKTLELRRHRLTGAARVAGFA